MIIYRGLTVHQEGQEFVSLLSETIDFFCIILYTIEYWSNFIMESL